MLPAARSTLPDVPAIANALTALDALATAFAPQVEALHVDLADLRGYHYQNGAIFSAFTAGEPNAIGNGGRYDGVGKAFGRARPATGFTLDLRQLHDVLARHENCEVRRARRRRAVSAGGDGPPEPTVGTPGETQLDAARQRSAERQD